MQEFLTENKDAIRSMAEDIRKLTAFITYLERRMGDIDSKPFGRETAQLKRALEGVKDQNRIADDHRHRIGDDADISDEPIAKVIYPGGVDVKGPQVWNDYRAWFTQNDGFLHVEAKVSQVANVNWVSDEIIEVFLRQDPTKYYVIPLGPVDEGSRDDEIQVGDTTLLLGQYLVVAVGDDDCNEPGLGFVMTNYLKVTNCYKDALHIISRSLTNTSQIMNVETQNSTRRGQNRRKPSMLMVRCLFR